MNKQTLLTTPILLLAPIAIAQQVPDFHAEQNKASIGFWENLGQLLDATGHQCPQVLYYSEGAPVSLFFQDSSRVTYAITLPDTSINIPDTIVNFRMFATGEGARYADPVPSGQKSHCKHFFLPHTAPLGITGVKGFDVMTYAEFCKDIDLHYHSGSGGLKMSFVCRPGFNPASLVLGFQGQDSLDVDIDGALRMWRNGRWLSLRQAVAFQVDSANNIIQLNWNAEYQANDAMGVVTFQFDTYDPDLPLILQAGPDPRAADQSDGLCWSSYLGGNAEDHIYTSGVDADGSYYVTGNTLSAYATFPNDPGFSLNLAPPVRPIFATRFNAQHEIKWTAYYGASTSVQYPNGLAIRNGGANGPEIYIGGYVQDNDLYLRYYPGAYMDSTGAGSGLNNGFITKLDTAGNLLWSTYFGNTNTVIMSLDVDGQGRLVIGGYSSGAVPFPATQPPGSFTQAYNAFADGFIVQLDGNDQPRWGTFVGDAEADQISAVRCRGGRIVAVGYTLSPGYLPIVDGGLAAYDQPAPGGTSDLTIAEFDENGAIQWSTPFGTADGEWVDGMNPLDIGPDGNILIVAHAGPNIPIVPGTGWYQDNPVGDQILIEFAPDRSRAWTTYLTAPWSTKAECVHVDANGNIYVAGRVSFNNAQPPLVNTVELTNFFYQPGLVTGCPIPNVGSDCFLMSWTPDHWLALATYFGGEEWGNPPYGGAPSTERITTLASTADFLYAAGTTSKIGVPDTSYFPLYDPGGDAWFQDHFNDQVPNGTDGFVTAFCIDAFTGLPHRPAPGNTLALTLEQLAPDLWVLRGLEQGQYELRIFDPLGKLVLRSVLRFAEGRSEPFGTHRLAPGTYIVQVVGRMDKGIPAGLKLPVTR